MKMSDGETYRLAASVAVRDQTGRILLVREADPRVRGRINLPGGHVNPGESLDSCALRELQEETGLQAALSGVIGVYKQTGGINVVFAAEARTSRVVPGDDILECCWMSLTDIQALPPEKILRPKKLYLIVSDLQSGRMYPLDLIRTLEPEDWES